MSVVFAQNKNPIVLIHGFFGWGNEELGNYYPGLVGGHCISVDPYYLIEFAKKNNFLIKSLITSRKVNEQFIIDIENKIKKHLIKNKIKINDKILFIGGTYKKNVGDFRNSGALKIFKKISKDYKNSIMYDPYKKFDNSKLIQNYKAVIILVLHDEIIKNNKIMKVINNSKLVMDIFQDL